MPESDINYLAVLVAAVISMFLGYIWYLPKLFGDAWMKIVGLTEEVAKKSAPKAMFGMFVVALISAFVLAHFVDFTQATTFGAGVVTGLWLWLGFSGAVIFSNFAFERRPFKWFLITAGYQLVNLAILGGVLAVWA